MVYSLTEPMSVIPIEYETPYTYEEGAVGGAGQFTMNAILRHARTLGNVDFIQGTAISIPSAMRFQKLGFELPSDPSSIDSDSDRTDSSTPPAKRPVHDEL